MHRSIAMISSGVLAAAVGLACFSLPAPAAAQPLPSYARPASAPGEETIRGVIVAVDGPYRITIRDERGFNDVVELHRGTIAVYPNPGGGAMFRAEIPET